MIRPANGAELSDASIERPMPPRIIHLLGGLRAIDDQSGQVSIQVTADQLVTQFPAPAYPQVYNGLRSLNLRPIGAEFLDLESYQGLQAPDWQCASVCGGFKLRLQRKFWAGARHAAQADDKAEIADLAGRASTYLDLLPIRILQLSTAYNQALRSYLAGQPAPDNVFFENTFRPYIDAAIHAFAADAASFRDVISESAWKLVLHETSAVTSLKEFRKRAKSFSEPITQSILDAAEPDGWLKRLSDLRNHITHVAPVGRGSSFQFCQPRRVRIGAKQAVMLHYPLLDEIGKVREHQRPVDFTDETAIRKALEEYKSFADASLDALEYAWETLDRLVGVLGQIGVTSGIRSEVPHFTDDDLVGEPTFKS